MSELGKVYLVGAGPGDPGLLTLRGQECLARADLVLYDGLVNPLLLRHTSAQAERTARTAGPQGRRLDQAEINSRLIAATRAGKTVVRLKGGDPFIFGRGAEEAQALAEAGIPFEVVPGITAATAAGEYAGIAFTHRERASAVAFVTGHEDPSKEDSLLDYDVLARFPGTLVFYMGLHRLTTIAGALVEHGMDASTPAAVISRASTPRQRVVVGVLEDLAARVQEAGLSPPSVIVVGECVRQREELTWFESRSLFGQRIGITRPVLEAASFELPAHPQPSKLAASTTGQADSEIAMALQRGAQPVLMPTMRIEPPQDWSDVDRSIASLDEYEWLIFTSANGVRFLLGRLWELGQDVRSLGRVKIAAIGPATGEALQAFSLRADVIPASYRAEALAAALAGEVSGRRVLWARADRGRDVLPVELTRAGARFDEVVVYRHVDLQAFPPGVTERLEAGELDWVGLSSPAIARQFAALLSPEAREHIGREVRLAAISGVTAEAAADVGLPIAAVAEHHTWEGLFAAIEAVGS